MSLNLDFISTEFNLKVLSNSENKAYLFKGHRLDVQRRTRAGPTAESD